MQIFLHRNTLNVESHDAGFSLLEILIVLSLMGLMMALVAPRLISSIDATKFSQTANAAAGKVSQMRAEAILNRKSFVIAPAEQNVVQTGYENKTLNLPNDWVVTGGPVYITASGLCTGGILDFIDPSGRRVRYEFMSPKCKAKRIAISDPNRN